MYLYLVIEDLSIKLETISKERVTEREEVEQLRKQINDAGGSKHNSSGWNAAPSFDRIKFDDVVLSDSVDWNEVPRNDDFLNDDETEQDQKIDLLLAGDSCIKHIDVNKINPGGNNRQECIRGGKINDIRNAIMEVNASCEVSHCVIHVGSNHIPEEPPHTVASKLISLLKEVRHNMPNTTVSFSAILPKYGPDFLPGINTINWLVFNSASEIGYAFIFHSNFASHGHINNFLICKDGVHPSFRGVAQLAWDIKK